MIDVHGLETPFRLSFAHASASRSRGQSVWVRARRGSHLGVGEGCPRAYVTSETLPGALDALAQITGEIATTCVDLQGTRAFIARHAEFIDANPSAWCAVECALLDLFARERGESVDGLLGLGAPEGTCTYSAVLGMQAPSKARGLIGIYASMGMRDYKIKIGDEVEHVRDIIAMILTHHRRAGLAAPRIRLDANNHWGKDLDRALHTLDTLRPHIVAVEEPLQARHFEGLSALSTALDLPIILDESVTTARDARAVMSWPGSWIFNIKISKFGGLLRASSFLDALAPHRPDVLLGAHVGESSVLTRAAQVLWRRLDGQVFAHEGAFGERLLERDAMEPSVEFGHGGQIELERYASPGWGLTPREVLV